MRQKKTISLLILGWIFLSLFSMINIGNGTNFEDLVSTSFKVGDTVTYKYRTYYYLNPVMGFDWSSWNFEGYRITEISEISESYNEITIKADFWDKSSLTELGIGDPDEENKVIGGLKIPPQFEDIIIPDNILPEDYKNVYLAQLKAEINNPAVTTTIQSYAYGQGLNIKHTSASEIIGGHTLLYATTGILLKDSYEISMGTTNDFKAEREIVPSRSTIDGADESYSDSMINPWTYVLFIGVPGVIISAVIIRKIVIKLKGIQVLRQDLSPPPTPIKKSRVLCPFCFTEIEGKDIYCLNCGKKI